MKKLFFASLVSWLAASTVFAQSDEIPSGITTVVQVVEPDTAKPRAKAKPIKSPAGVPVVQAGPAVGPGVVVQADGQQVWSGPNLGQPVPPSYGATVHQQPGHVRLGAPSYSQMNLGNGNGDYTRRSYGGAPGYRGQYLGNGNGRWR